MMKVAHLKIKFHIPEIEAMFTFKINFTKIGQVMVEICPDHLFSKKKINKEEEEKYLNLRII